MISLIAAFAQNRVIGKDGRIPWHIPGEQARFRRLTVSHTVIMGRRTYEEIGHPLPDRQTIVLSRDPAFAPPGCDTAASLDDALAAARSEEIFIAGGAAVYAEALPLCSRLYITEIDLAVEGDTFFPAFDETDFLRTVDAEIPGNPGYRYVTYTRIR